jgi:PPK2 family polyphosphate:nucleotide phosphotransferase
MKKYLVRPGRRVHLESIDPEEHHLASNKEEGGSVFADLRVRLAELQEKLYASHDHKLLIVLQGMDTSGKDGTIRHVAGAFNPQGIRIVSFKKPTSEELDHDYLWRVHREVPAKGEIVVFNRSHYEDVLVVRVHELVPKSVWKQRYDQINEFERLLADSGTIILKFFLHIDRDEQRRRLRARLADKTKWWKFNEGDLKERKLWNEYQRAYEDAISKTAHPWAPWFIVPANRKWYRDLIVGSIVVKTLEGLNLKYPKIDLSRVVVR